MKVKELYECKAYQQANGEDKGESRNVIGFEKKRRIQRGMMRDEKDCVAVWHMDLKVNKMKMERLASSGAGIDLGELLLYLVSLLNDFLLKQG